MTRGHSWIIRDLFGWVVLITALVLSEITYDLFVPYVHKEYKIYKLQKDLENELALYKRGIEQDIPQAMYGLGYRYHTGCGVEKDYIKARELYQKAADKGEMLAQYNLGFMYKNGEGVEANLEKARYYYELSAARGYSSAFSQLANMYSKGIGVEQDLTKATELEERGLKLFGTSFVYQRQINNIIQYQLGEIK